MTHVTSFDKSWKKTFSTSAQGGGEDYRVSLSSSKEGLEGYKKYFVEYFRPYIQRNNSRTRILDIGSGPGTYTELLAKEGFQAQGVDYSQEMVEVAKKRTNNAIPFSVADIYHLPFKDNSFDIVICFAVFQTVEDCDRALAEIFRVLKPRGVIIITTLNRFSLLSILSRKSPNSSFPLIRYNPYVFSKRLSDIGFTQIQLKGIYLFPKPVHFLTNAILKSRLYKVCNVLLPLFLSFSHSFYIEGRKGD